jgi:hypothetical protein
MIIDQLFHLERPRIDPEGWHWHWAMLVAA